MNPYLKLAYQPYKWFFVIPMVFLLTMVSGLVCIIVGMILKSKATNIIAVIWAKLCCAIAPIKVTIHGKKNYGLNTSYVIVANHQSMVDIPVLHGFLGLPIKWVMKKELRRIPVFGTACKALGCVFVDRKNPTAAIDSIEKAKTELSDKACVLFFAEGTRSRDGVLMPFKKGAFRFAHETGQPILPITIKNSIKLLPSDSLDLIPGSVDVFIHSPISVREITLDDIDQTIEFTRKTISDPL